MPSGHQGRDVDEAARVSSAWPIWLAQRLRAPSEAADQAKRQRGAWKEVLHGGAHDSETPRHVESMQPPVRFA
jgi:hypothetical protein